jgi:hypothetical protein
MTHLRATEKIKSSILLVFWPYPDHKIGTLTDLVAMK